MKRPPDKEETLARRRRDMVDAIRAAAATLPNEGVDLDARVLNAMAEIPRHAFVTDDATPDAYANKPLDIGYAQTISQPLIVAVMSSLARPKPSDCILEVGTGSGYQTAVLAALCRHVYSIERIPELSARAGEALNTTGVRNVSLTVADGTKGWPEHAPFDAIVVTAAPREIPEALTEQLATGGRLVIPVGENTQDLLLIERLPDGTVRRKTVLSVRFVPLLPG